MGKCVIWRTACGNTMEMAILWNTIWELRHTFKQGMEFRSSITNEMVIVKAVRASHLPQQCSKGLRYRVSERYSVVQYQLGPREGSVTDINIATDFPKRQTHYMGTKCCACVHGVKSSKESNSILVILKEGNLWLVRDWSWTIYSVSDYSSFFGMNKMFCVLVPCWRFKCPTHLIQAGAVATTAQLMTTKASFKLIVITMVLHQMNGWHWFWLAYSFTCIQSSWILLNTSLCLLAGI